MRSSAMSGHSGLQLLLRFALHSITKPLLQFFPFNSTHFWNGFLQIFILSSSVNVDQIWAHRFFSLLHLLTLTASQFSVYYDQGKRGKVV
ncbi:hypothetical protein TYRP_002830 [Tyrophagus putrescentiae]|nr:hypothetical protein TYRP_002830 [Tyrophagus putrescentiae]